MPARTARDDNEMALWMHKNLTATVRTASGGLKNSRSLPDHLAIALINIRCLSCSPQARNSREQMQSSFCFHWKQLEFCHSQEPAHLLGLWIHKYKIPSKESVPWKYTSNIQIFPLAEGIPVFVWTLFLLFAREIFINLSKNLCLTQCKLAYPVSPWPQN